MDKIIGISHLAVCTSDINESLAFYMNNLGFEIEYEFVVDKPDGSWVSVAMIRNNDINIELMEFSDKKAFNHDSVGSLNHISLKVKKLNELIDELKSKDVKFETDEHRQLRNEFYKADVIYINGPSSERIELIEFL